MDTITHGIAGALVGKAFFAGSAEVSAEGEAAVNVRAAGRVGIIAATLGGVFPDIDTLQEIFGNNDLAIIESHRAVTHSFVCLPLFALGLAAFTWWICRRRKLAAPSFAALTGICAAGIALHILLDLITSFGTMIWSPLSYTRAAWDLTFIIDFTLTATVLLPQVVAWAYADRVAQPARAAFLWGFFTLLVFGARWLARSAGIPFSPWAVIVAAVLLAALFFLPVVRGWGFRIPRRTWCRAGVFVFAAYLGACAVAHHAAMQRVKEFAAQHNVAAEQAGAMPMPPWVFRWSGLIRTAEGVYQGWFSLLDRRGPAMRFFGDAPPNLYIEAARKLPAVQSYLRFARFPQVTYAERGGLHIVSFTDLRFLSRRTRASSFDYRVTFNSAGNVLQQGWGEE